MWVSHHQMFTIIRRTTPTFLFLNVIFLLPVAFVPYPTALVAQHILDPEGRTTAVLIYGTVSVVIALMFNVLWAIRLPSRAGRRESPAKVACASASAS